MTIPNLITSLRIILAPIFIIYLLNEKFLPALIVFVIAGLSDGADGLVARVFNQKSTLGSYLDPLADKILLIGAFVVLAVINFVPSWLTVVVISRDILILLGVLILFLSGLDFQVRPSIWSKLTTCMQLVTVFVVLSDPQVHYSPKFQGVIFWITGIFTVGSGLHYMYYWFKIMGEGGGPGEKQK